MRTRHISLKGTWEYSAPRLVKEGGLAVGQELALRREPDSKFDRNAVRVFRANSKLGYLPKNLSAEIVAYLDSGGRYSATVAHLGTRTKNGKSYPSIAVDLCLHGMPEHPGVDELEQAAASLKRIRGIYRISNSAEQKSYVGSSADVGKRLIKHLDDLLNGEHGNHLLSAAWIRHGAATFGFHLVEELKQGDLLDREAYHIRQLGTYPRGFNHSSDGQGKTAMPASKVAELKQQGAFRTVSRPYAAATQSASPLPPQASPSPSAARPPKGGSGCLILLAFAITLGTSIPLVAMLGSRQWLGRDMSNSPAIQKQVP
ncbi:GIY-YIG nuclease family protein [Akkermansiaceae bacterium]|nr:GIY-YIG nuclease family protein [Akkermansiaceae bacterium]